jgi:hypothetical protein
MRIAEAGVDDVLRASVPSQHLECVLGPIATIDRGHIPSSPARDQLLRRSDLKLRRRLCALLTCRS